MNQIKVKANTEYEKVHKFITKKATLCKMNQIKVNANTEYNKVHTLRRSLAY